MNLTNSLVRIISEDNLELPALLLRPAGSKKVAIFLHGNGDSGVFYKGNLINALAESLSKKGISLLALNNRGARYKKSLIIHGSGMPGQEKKVMSGVHYELINDCVLDIDGAVNYLKDKGFEKFYGLGFSTGANKLCLYESTKKTSPFSKHILAGPGDDCGIYYSELGEKKYFEAIKLADKYINNSSPTKIMPKYSGVYSFTAQSAKDILDPNEPYNIFPYFEATVKRLGKKKLFKEYSQVEVPLYVIFGENDEYTHTAGGTQEAINLLKKFNNPISAEKSKFTIMNKADHGFHGHEAELANKISNWLSI